MARPVRPKRRKFARRRSPDKLAARTKSYFDKAKDVNYISHMIEVRRTDAFSNWFKSLKDIRAKARIEIRIARVELGNLGDVKFFGGIGELRIDYGPGYRVYFVKRGDAIVILLCGGDKSSQKEDIRQALAMAKELDR